MRAWKGIDASRAARRCGRGSTASPPTSASTCCSRQRRRARPMDLGPAGTADAPGAAAARSHLGQPIADDRVSPADGDPAELAGGRETIRLAFVAALQHLPPASGRC